MRTKRFWLVVTITLCAADCVGLGVFLTLSRPTPAPYQRLDTADLFSLQAAKLDSLKPACRLIHYTAKTCPICAQEYPNLVRVEI